MTAAVYDPHAEFQQRQAADQRAIAERLQRGVLRDRGRALLGYELAPINGRPNAPIEWKRVNRPQLDGLPVSLCSRAMAAAEALDAAKAALEQAEQRYEAWQAHHRPSIELSNLKHEEMTIEERTAHRRADEDLDRVAIELASVHADLAAINNRLASLPREQYQLDAQYQLDRQRLATERSDLAKRLAAYGLLT